MPSKHEPKRDANHDDKHQHHDERSHGHHDAKHDDKKKEKSRRHEVGPHKHECGFTLLWMTVRALCEWRPSYTHGGGCGSGRVHRYTMSKQLGRSIRRACAGTPVHYEQIVREEGAASVCGYTGTLRANSQGDGCSECVRVNRYTMSKQSGRRMHMRLWQSGGDDGDPGDGDDGMSDDGGAAGAYTRPLFSST